MEKVVITQEQANAIEWVMKFSDKSSTVEEHIEYRLEESGWKLDDLKPLNELSTDYLIRALYIGYEVEPEFKVGDWVVCEVPEGASSNIYKVTDNAGYSVNLDNMYGNFKKNKIRHATESEIAEEKERRNENKAREVISSLKSEEVAKIRDILAWEYDSNGNLTGRLDVSE